MVGGIACDCHYLRYENNPYSNPKLVMVNLLNCMYAGINAGQSYTAIVLLPIVLYYVRCQCINCLIIQLRKSLRFSEGSSKLALLDVSPASHRGMIVDDLNV